MVIVKEDARKELGNFGVCEGRQAGAEAVIHAIRVGGIRQERVRWYFLGRQECAQYY